MLPFIMFFEKRKPWQQFTNLFSLLSRTSHIWPPTSARWWVIITSCMMIIAYLRFIIITIFIMSIMVTIIMAMIRRCSRTWASSLSSSLTTCPASPEEVTRCDFVLRSLLPSMCCWSYQWVLLRGCESYQVFFVLPRLRDIMVIGDINRCDDVDNLSGGARSEETVASASDATEGAAGHRQVGGQRLRWELRKSSSWSWELNKSVVQNNDKWSLHWDVERLRRKTSNI